MPGGLWKRLSARISAVTGGRGDADGVVNVRFYTDYNVCNFSCPYCIAGQYDKASLRAEWDLAAFHRIIHNLTLLPHTLNVRLGVGGEFFLSPDLIRGAKTLSRSRNVRSVNLITNLAFSIATYESFFEGFDRAKLALVASYHPSEIKDHARWVATARHMNSTLDFAVVLIGHPPLLPALPALVSDLRGHGLPVFVHGFIGWYRDKVYPSAYSREERRILREVCGSDHDYEYLVEAKQPGLCNAGFGSFFVGMDGVVVPCGRGLPFEPMGNLLDSPRVQLNAGPQACPATSCLCDTDNINTVEFQTRYVHTGLNQHRYMKRAQGDGPPSRAVASRVSR